MNKFKKNQIVVYSIVLMLVVAGYLNYIENDKSLEISSNIQNNNTNIGDATLVSNNEEIEEKEGEVEKNKIEEEIGENTTNEATEETGNTSQRGANGILDEDDEYFANSKLEREKMYSQMLETYQKILDNTTVSEEQKSIASNEIKNINNKRNAIMICENLLAIKGFKEAVILANGESVNIVVNVHELTAEDVAQIQNIVTREMGTTIENIHIMEK